MAQSLRASGVGVQLVVARKSPTEKVFCVGAFA